MAMPPFVQKILSSSAVRKAVVALVLAVLAALGVSLQGCGQLRANQPKLDVLKCQLDAVADLLGSTEMAEQVVAAAKVGDYQRAVVLILSLGADVQAVAKAFDDCDGSLPAPSPEGAPAELIRASWED